MDIAEMLGSAMHSGQTPAVMSSPWRLGMTTPAMLGTLVFPLLSPTWHTDCYPARRGRKG